MDKEQAIQNKKRSIRERRQERNRVETEEKKVERLRKQGSGHAPPPSGKFSNLEPWKHHLLLSAQLFLSNLAACYSSNFT